MKKNTKRIVIALIVAVIAVGITWGIKLYLREKDPRWQAAKEIYKVQTALQQVDENAKLESVSEVRSFEITSPNYPTIYYYCTITSYLSEQPKEITGLNKTALSMVVDMDSLENTRDCKVGNLDAVMGEKDGFHYLCWTYSPKYSCLWTEEGKEFVCVEPWFAKTGQFNLKDELTFMQPGESLKTFLTLSAK